ncbi:MAG: ABC transporter ATP-binding protein [Pleomorphochaeta sp.]
MSFVEVNNVSYSYKDNQILKDLSFKINKGETFGLVGNSGSGKTTIALLLLKLLTGYDGNILIDDIDLSQIKKKKQYKNFYRNVQIVFQDPYSSLDSKKTVGYLIEEPLIIHNCKDKNQRVQRVDQMMELVGLDKKYKNSFPHQLSGGLRQRLAIAISLILNPKFVVLDECVSALDISIQAGILNLLNDLKEKLNLTFLFISHDLNVVGYICDRIAVLNKGEIVEIQETKKLFENPIDSYTKNLFNNIY